MANEKAINIQDVFLNHIRKNKTYLTVFLVNGVKLIGILKFFDEDTIILVREGYSQLIYKHSISTILPQEPVILFDYKPSYYNEDDVIVLQEKA